MSTKNRLDPIPHPPTKPVVGNMLSLDSTAPVQHLARLAKELGPIFWLDMMGAPLVIVSGHDLIDELSDEKRFDKAVRGSLRRVRMLGGDALFTAETQEPNWQKAHNILLPTFAHRMMQTYHEGMLDIAVQDRLHRADGPAGHGGRGLVHAGERRVVAVQGPQQVQQVTAGGRSEPGTDIPDIDQFAVRVVRGQ